MNIDAVIDTLINKYTSGNLIPVLGCELFKIKIGINETVNIHEYLIKESFYPSDEWPEAPSLLSELPLAVPDFDHTSLLGCYNQLQNEQKLGHLLDKLSNMKNFKVFLIASVFKEFENEFKRNNLEDVEVYKNDGISVHGLPSINFANGKKKIIYLFDNLDSSLCAISDEQLLESMYSLANSPRANPEYSLLSFLQDKTLLFIGCDFPDWFMRYCIRVLSNNPFSTKPTYIINDHPTKLKYQEFFFSKHNIKLIQTSPVDEFIEKFYKKALKKETFKNRFAGSRIFISYSKRYDTEVAKSLYQSFKEQGVEAFFDEEAKTVGSHKDKITEYIMDSKTKVLVSVISKGMFDSVQNDEFSYIKEVEWLSAQARNMVATTTKSNQTIAIVPYFVDNEHDYIEKLPSYINTQFRFGEHHGGFDKLFTETKTVLS